jgi:hypothetical protein
MKWGKMHLLSHKPATSGDILLVAFGRREERPESVWALSFGMETIHTIVRSGQELAFTAQENPTPSFNGPDYWVITLFFTTAESAAQYEAELRSLKSQVLFLGDHEVSGIVARGGHSMQAIGVSDSVVELLAYRHGAKARLVSSAKSAHRDYYLLPAK